MTYIALARKWRPRSFTDLVGQDHIKIALINSLKQQRLHHAYLFTGTRGVGKTSIARLLAKALNCEQGISSEPCLTCAACVAIEQGCFIDLIEIDGASRTRVEDTRDLLDNVQYSPTHSRFKVYLIDEVHMLSQHSFNALLKTLEEPPTHVKFILATTDPQKLPVTVLSRCLQFNLKHITESIISQQLQHILNIEKIAYEPEAVSVLSYAARGSMRDALSLLDQAIVSGDQYLRAADVKYNLGYTQQDYAIQLLQALADTDSEKLLTISKTIRDEGELFHYVMEEILSHLHQISIQQTLSNQSSLLNIKPEIVDLSMRLSAEDTQLFYQIALKGRQDMSLAPTMAIGFEMTLLRMYAFKPATKTSLPTLAHQFIHSDITKESSANHKKPDISFKEEKKIELQSSPESTLENKTLTIKKDEITPASWGDILTKLKLQGLALSAAENSELVSYDHDRFVLRTAKGHLSLFTPTVVRRIEQALKDYYQKSIKIIVDSDDNPLSSPYLEKQALQKQHIDSAEQSLKDDPVFQQIKQQFSGEVIKNSVRNSKL
jgi:DNA polymerase-3 subunit gamma/tau